MVKYIANLAQAFVSVSEIIVYNSIRRATNVFEHPFRRKLDNRILHHLWCYKRAFRNKWRRLVLIEEPGSVQQAVILEVN